MQCILSFRELLLDEYKWQLISVNLMVADCITPLSMYRPKLADPVFNMSGDFGQCSESFNVFGYLPRGCRINLSYTQNFYFGWYITKNAVGGHVGRDTRIRKSEHPLLPGPRSARSGEQMAQNSDFWAAMYVKLTILTNAGGCWCVFVFSSRAVCLKLRRTEPPFHKDIVLHFWIFYDIPSMIHNLK